MTSVLSERLLTLPPPALPGVQEAGQSDGWFLFRLWQCSAFCWPRGKRTTSCSNFGVQFRDNQVGWSPIAMATLIPVRKCTAWLCFMSLISNSQTKKILLFYLTAQLSLLKAAHEVTYRLIGCSAPRFSTTSLVELDSKHRGEVRPWVFCFRAF